MPASVTSSPGGEEGEIRLRTRTPSPVSSSHSSSPNTLGVTPRLRSRSRSDVLAQINIDTVKVPVRVKCTLGVGESVQAIYVVIAGFYLNAYLLEVACLPPSYVGLIQLVSGMWDAFNDPFIGTLSDRTWTRFGRRRPWLLGASIPLGLLYFGIWNQLADGAGDGEKLAYYMFMYIGISAGITSIQVQVGSLAPELTDDYDERTSLSTYRLGIGNTLALVCVIIHTQIITYWTDRGDVGNGYKISGAIFGSLMAFNALFTFFNITERYTPPKDAEPMKCIDGLAIVFSNRAFLYVVAIYLCGPTAVVLVQSNVLMFCKYILEEESLVDYIIAIVQGMAMICLPFWNWLARRQGKKFAYYCGAAVMAAALCTLFWVDKDRHGVEHTIFVACMAGTGIGLLYMTPYSMLPDVIEADELETGQRREGIYFGFFTIFLKLAVTGGLAITNFLLSIAGYIKPHSTCGASEVEYADEQPDSVIQIIRALVGPIPAGLLCLGIWFCHKYPITKEEHTRMLKRLKLRKMRAEGRDPQTIESQAWLEDGGGDGDGGSKAATAAVAAVLANPQDEGGGLELTDLSLSVSSPEAASV